VRGLVEAHISLHWLAAPRHLLMLQLMGYLPFTERFALLRPSTELLYVSSIGKSVQLAVGLGLGDWVWKTSDAKRTRVHVFPLLDVWFRF